MVEVSERDKIEFLINQCDDLVKLSSELKIALKQAVEVIKHWHGEEYFDAYLKRAPEMKLIREALHIKCVLNSHKKR